MKNKFPKLIRDKIPLIIAKENKKPLFHIAKKEEYILHLKNKLLEEVNEFIDNEDVEEIADILEIIYSICEQKKISIEEIEEIRLEKKQAKGSFKNKIILQKIC